MLVERAPAHLMEQSTLRRRVVVPHTAVVDKLTAVADHVVAVVHHTVAAVDRMVVVGHTVVAAIGNL